MAEVVIVDTQAERLWFLNKLREQQMDKAVIYSLEECSDEQWLEILKNAWVLTAHVDGEPAGLCWFDNINGRTAQSHFVLFRDNFEKAKKLGALIINWLEDKLQVRALTGITPKPYRQSHSLMKDWGFEKVMELPEACYMAQYKKHVDGVLYVRKA